ncbi:MAG: hypothetical protein CM1200mP2_13330 [Planctomycetaceae bacterium]|nr:MAG: hypothetical protein CM1200mP2_13330 [Planctomycetaceae bacterium]
MLAYKRSLYLFGGVYPRYGPPSGPADLRTMGSLNDLWRFDLSAGRWQQLEADNGPADFDPSAKRPCGRVLPRWAQLDGTFYLFGGLTSLAKGWKIRLLNDLWSYQPGSGRWTLLEPNDGRVLDKPAQVDARGRPPMRRWVSRSWPQDLPFWRMGGYRNRVVLSPQLWSFDVDSKLWDDSGRGEEDRRRPWPAKRYCPAVTEYDGRIYLWGGRFPEDRSPQFYKTSGRLTRRPDVGRSWPGRSSGSSRGLGPLGPGTEWDRPALGITGTFLAGSVARRETAPS